MHHGVERGKDLLEGQIAGGAEEYEGIGFECAHVRSTSVPTQLFQFFQQIERERHTGQIDPEVALQAQCDARPAQRRAAEAPLGGVGFRSR